MSSTINYTQNFTTKVNSVQLVMNLNYEVLIPENDSVRLLSQIVEEMDLSGLNQVYSLFGRNSAVPPRIMLKIILYAYMEATGGKGDYAYAVTIATLVFFVVLILTALVQRISNKD